MQKITPFLWFNDNAEEAMNFYCSIFKDSKITTINHYPDIPVAPKPGAVMVVAFELLGKPYLALNGDSHFGDKARPARSAAGLRGGLWVTRACRDAANCYHAH